MCNFLSFWVVVITGLLELEKFLFSWIPLFNTIILRCNMPLLQSKLKKLWVIQYFWSFTACPSSHPSSVHLNWHPFNLPLNLILHLSLISAFIYSSLFISSFIYSSLFISSFIYSSLFIKKNKVPDEGEMRREMKKWKKKFCPNIIKPNIVLSEIPFTGVGCLWKFTDLQTYIHTYVHYSELISCSALVRRCD